MHLTTSQLPIQLHQGLAALYVLHGAAPLLVMEAADLIRSTAKAAGYTEREVLQFDAKSEWRALDEAAGSLSLFGDWRVLEVRLPTGKPGKVGGEALMRLAAQLPEHTVTLVQLPQLDRDALKSTWFNALAGVAVVVEGKAVLLEHLPDWLMQRAHSLGLQLSLEAAQWFAEKTEGNLLAAQQELLKLALLVPAGIVDLAAVQDAVLDVARYDIQQFSAALQAGKAVRALKILEGLYAEKEALPLILWQASEVLRQAARGGTPLRLSTAVLAQFAQLLARADRQFKGVAAGDAWASLRVCIGLIQANQ